MRPTNPASAVLAAVVMMASAGIALASGTSRPWVGVVVQDAVDGGARVVAVVPGGPAAESGLRAGDLVVELDGKPVLGRESLSLALERLAPGDTAGIVVLRDGVSRRVRVAVRDRSERPRGGVPAPPVRPAVSFRTDIGIDAVRIPESLRRHYGAPGDAGVLVSRIRSGSAAEDSGLAAGDVIVRIDGERVVDPMALRFAWLSPERESTMRLDVVRDGKTMAVTIPRSSVMGRSRAIDPGIAVPLVPGDPDGSEDRVRMLREEIRALERRIVELERELRESRESE